MLFNSLAFAVFFPLVTLGYFVLPQRFRWSWLLVASCVMYMWFIPAYIAILFGTIAVDYVAALQIARSQGRARRIWLIVSIVSTVVILVVFKYFNFFNDNLHRLATFLHWNYGVDSLKLILPIGLSFHTFQSLSYVIEVYRGRQHPERHFGIYALYVMFYPQLVAGPIERPQNLLHQFREEHSFDPDRVASGLGLMARGLIKKMVVADRLSIYVNQVFGNISNYPTVPVVMAVVFFSFQIYCDFSGYSDIARGSARVMGFELMENFDHPYRAGSVAEFWRRWHRSLSTWLRDYVYFPLGGSRTTPFKHYRNILITFLLSGLWHGANWTFIVWGALHGTFLILGSVSERPRARLATWIFGPEQSSRLRQGLAVVTTFALVSFAWIFFRARTLGDAWGAVRTIGKLDPTIHLTTLCAEKGPFNLLLCGLSLGLLALLPRLPRQGRRNHALALAIGATVLIAVMGSGTDEFIYFQF